MTTTNPPANPNRTFQITLPEKQRYLLKTYSGVMYDLFAFREEMVHLPDIARALSRTPRYRTHTERFYSVAEHCLIMHRWAHEAGWDSPLRLWTLLHDGAEAYSGDLPGPIKETLSEMWNPMEEAILSAIMSAVVINKEKDLPGRRAQAANLLGSQGLGSPPPQVEDLDVGIRCAEGDLFFAGQDYLQHYANRLAAIGATKAGLVKIGQQVARELDVASLGEGAKALPPGEARLLVTEDAWLGMVNHELHRFRASVKGTPHMVEREKVALPATPSLPNPNWQARKGLPSFKPRRW
jgi:hypothetical protein